MISRENAPVYETVLIRFIEDRNSDEAIKAIDRLLHHEGPKQPSLTYVDENDMDFIRFALYNQLRSVAKKLLDTGAFDENEAILFGVNSQGQTLICQATECGYHDIVEQLLDCTFAFLDALPQDQRQDSPAYQIWLKADNQKNTLLHYAAANKNVHLYSHLINLIRKNINAAALINQFNAAGNAPLHIALGQDGMPHVDLINQLLYVGANFGLPNSKGTTPFDYLRRRTTDQQATFIHRLDDKNKQLVFDYYEAYLSTHPDDEKSKQAYFTAKSLQGLTDLTIAHLELNPKVPLRSSYKVNQVEKSIDGREMAAYNLATRLPRYSMRLLASHSIFPFSDRPEDIRKSLLLQDKILLDDLVQYLEATLTDWAARKPIQIYKIAAIAAPALAWLAWGGTMAYLFYTAANPYENPTDFFYNGQPVIGPNYQGQHPHTTHLECHKDIDSFGDIKYHAYRHVVYNAPYFDPDGNRLIPHTEDVFYPAYPSFTCTVYPDPAVYDHQKIVIGIASAILNLTLSYAIPKYFWHKEVTLSIPAADWQAVLLRVNSDITSKLAALPDSDLPISKATLDQLQKAISITTEDMLQNQAVERLTKLLQIVKTIRTDMQTVDKPLSSIPHALIPSSEDDSLSGVELHKVLVMTDEDSSSRTEYSSNSDNENRPLLGL